MKENKVMTVTFEIRKSKETDRRPTAAKLKEEFGENWLRASHIFTIYDPETKTFHG